MSNWPWKWIIGGLITLWVAPGLTRLVQDRAAARDYKAQLAVEMSTSKNTLVSVGIFRAFDLDQLRTVGALPHTKSGKLLVHVPLIPSRTKFDRTFQVWEGQTEQIRTKLGTTFRSRPDLLKAWNDFDAVVRDWYFVSESPGGSHGYANTLVTDAIKFNKDTSNWHWGSISITTPETNKLNRGQVDYDSVEAYYDAYNRESWQLGDALTAIVGQVLRAPPDGYSTRLCDLGSTLVLQDPGRACGLGDSAEDAVRRRLGNLLDVA
jgi:hypothetical protein